MLKKFFSLVVCLAVIVTMVPAVSLVTSPMAVDAAADNKVILPANDGKTNNTSYTLGPGTDAEVTVYCDFRASTTAPTASITPKYVAIHNTGTYVSTANAKNTHNNTNKISSDMAWHYTVDDVSVYQALQDNRKGWHTGKSTTGVPSNDNSIGIEMCVHNFPATETFDGEQWNDGTAIMTWWENQFDKTMKNTAYLALVLCKRWGLNWETDIKQHYDALSYAPGGKDCPMQMRATYDPATNTFKEAGGYVDGRDGYFWQIFWGYVQSYAAGATVAGNNTLTSAAKLGTWQVSATDGLNVRNGAGAGYDKIGALEYKDVVKVTELSGNWGKITMPDGTEGWTSIVNYGTYIGVDALAYSTRVNAGNVTAFYNQNGSMTVKNTSGEAGQFDLMLPHSIGTATTPFLSARITPVTGNGFYFGITQFGSGYFMMHNSTLAEKLTVTDTSTYCTSAETLEIDLKEYWVPEDGQRIDSVRLYVAPNTTLRIDYFYFAANAGVVADETYNVMATANVNLMRPDTLKILNDQKPGSYVYDNGKLTITADTDAGFDLMFDVNETFDIATLKRWLVEFDANVPFNISLYVTNANGAGYVSLVHDFYPTFVETAPTGEYLPACAAKEGLDLYMYYKYNDIIPADGKSIVKQVHINLGGAGTAVIDAIQLCKNNQFIGYEDGVYKADAVVPEQPDPPKPVIVGDVNGDGEITTTDARDVLLFIVELASLDDDQRLAADFNGDGEITTLDARDILLSIVS